MTSIDQLKPVEKYILLAIFTSAKPNDTLLKELKPRLMEYYSRHPEKQLPEYHAIYSHVHRLIDIGFLAKKGERPLRLMVPKEHYNNLREYIINYIKIEEIFYAKQNH